jgi:hypothetical protein
MTWIFFRARSHLPVDRAAQLGRAATVMSRSARVCCRCGTPAAAHSFGSSCGLNLQIQQSFRAPPEYAAWLREQ